jgi:nucleotide-binding universal stress UspA family protein
LSDPTASPPGRLLIAYDGSEAAAAAIAAAARLFPAAEAVVAYVRGEPATLERAALGRIAVPDGVLAEAATAYERDAEQHAQQRAEQGRALAERGGLRASAAVHTGFSPWRALIRAAAACDSDVIVCGSRGQGPFSRALLGSTSSSLLHHADRAVLVVPPGAGELDGPVVIGYDGSGGSRAAIALAARLLPGRRAVVVHAWSSPLRRSYAESSLAAVPLPEVGEVTRELEVVFAEHAREVAEEGAALARDDGLAARGTAVEAGDGAWRALSATARAEGAAAIVTGCRGRGAVGATVLGSVSAGLAHNAELPILVVRDDRV